MVVTGSHQCDVHAPICPCANNATHDEIRIASTKKLKNMLKEDIPVELDDMINYELYIREFS